MVDRDKLQVPSAALPALAQAPSASAESVREEKQCRCSKSHVTGILIYIETSPSPHSRTIPFQLGHVLSYNHKPPMGISKCHPVVVHLDCQYATGRSVKHSRLCLWQCFQRQFNPGLGSNEMVTLLMDMKALFGCGGSSEAGPVWKKWVTENGYLGLHLWLASSYFTISLLSCRHDVNCSVQLWLSCMADTSENVHRDWLLFPSFHARYLTVIKSLVPLFPSWTFIWALAEYRMLMWPLQVCHP